jgi:hypothetical protein
VWVWVVWGDAAWWLAHRQLGLQVPCPVAFFLLPRSQLILEALQQPALLLLHAGLAVSAGGAMPVGRGELPGHGDQPDCSPCKSMPPQAAGRGSHRSTATIVVTMNLLQPSSGH